jgi:hypothetical protein
LFKKFNGRSNKSRGNYEEAYIAGAINCPGLQSGVYVVFKKSGLQPNIFSRQEITIP